MKVEHGRRCHIGSPRGGFRISAALVVLVVAVVSPRVAPGEVDPGRAIIDKTRALDDTTRAWKDRSQRLKLVIRDGRGSDRERELTLQTKREGKGEDKTLMVFLSPPEVRGTGLLQYAHASRDAEQWLFLPELERVRQITSRGKKQSFIGTDFTFRDLELIEDVLEWTEAEANARLVGREKDGAGRDLARIELTPVGRDVDYQRILLSISEPDLVLRRMEFYEEGAEPVKVLVFDRVEDIGGIPTALRLEMTQPARKSATVVDIGEVRYNAGLEEDLFTRRSLEHALDHVE